MNRRTTALALLLVLPLLTVACGDEEAATNADAVAVDDNAPRAQHESFEDVVEEAGVAARWPSGCSSRTVRARESGIDPERSAVVDVTCDRFGDKECGCKFTVYHETPGGGPFAAEDVMNIMSNLVGLLDVEVLRQRPIVRGDREGVAAYCRGRDGVRHVWIEGFLVDDKALVAMAWDDDEALFRDEEIRDFFASLSMAD